VRALSLEKCESPRCGSSLSSLTVSSISEVPAAQAGPAPSGDRLWVAAVDACEVVDPADNGDSGPELYDLSAVTTDGFADAPSGAPPPSGTNILDTTLAPGQCAQGYAAFWVPGGETVAGVEYNPDGPFSRYEWTRG
jgi:hypothetical protein